MLQYLHNSGISRNPLVERLEAYFLGAKSRTPVQNVTLLAQAHTPTQIPYFLRKIFRQFSKTCYNEDG